MKKLFLIFAVGLLLQESTAQTATGKVVSFFINAKTLQNTGGENPNRKVSVYLPLDYDQVRKRFSVIYHLPTSEQR